MSTFFGFTDPFEDLLNMQLQMESLMNALGTPTTTPVPRLTTGGGATTTGDVGGRGLTTTTGGGGVGGKVGKRGWSPSLDVCETDKSLVIHAELPGCNKEDIKLSIDNNRLVLQGKKRAHKKEKGENWVRRERFRGSFYRSMPLPRNVDVQNIQANYDNGILEILVPKSQELAKRQTIDIKSAQGLKAQQPQQQEQERIQPRETTTTTTALPQRTEETQEMKQPQEEQQRFDVKPEGLQPQEQKRVEEGGVPQPPQPPQLQQEQQKFEQQPKQEQFGQEEKLQPGWEQQQQQQPLQQQQEEGKQNIDIKFQGEQQQPELKDQQLAKLQESSIFIQGGESGQESLSQEREKGSVQAM
jgi:HSP20 family protein